MTHQRVVFQAGLARIVLGAFALVLLPVLYPGLAEDRAIFVTYVASTLVMQVLIYKDVGGAWRTFGTGLVDLALLGFLVHRVGSVDTMLVALYLFGVTANALVAPFRVSIALASLAAVSYNGVLLAEQLGWLPYGVAPPSWSAGSKPHAVDALIAGGMVALLLVLSTMIVGYLVHAVRSREADLLVANARLEELSSRDPLTQLYNRRHLLARIEAELARVKRGRALALVMIDLDGFKRVNDRQGHLRGDMLLRELADALGGAIRATDVAGRYGGDEFLIVLADTEEPQARTAAERLAQTIAQVGAKFDAVQPVTASVGVAVATADDGVTALLRRADENAYRAKQGGGNRVVLTA